MIAESIPDDIFAEASSGWHSTLPRVTATEVETSSALITLPVEFAERIKETVAKVLAQYSLTQTEQVSVSLTEVREVELSLAAQTTPKVVATFVCEPKLTRFNVELDAGFTISLIDRMLGGNGDGPNKVRKLTAAELAVVEFLFLSLASDLNQRIELPLVRLESVGDQAAEQKGCGFAAKVLLSVNNLSGIIRAQLPAQALTEIGNARELMRPLDSKRAAEYAEEKLNSYVQTVPDLRLSLLVGQTDLTRGDLQLLETGDVMLVEQPALTWRNGRIRGSLRLRAGDGDESLILGDITENNTSTIHIRVSSINIGEPRTVEERLTMVENETEEVLPVDDNGIDNLVLTMRVELAARRLRLGELAKLRSDQLLDLGCSPTDPVDLVVDGRRVARGELVDIEGRLGVRIKQVTTQVA